MSHGPQEVVDNAYELVIKSELAVRLESTNSRSAHFWIRKTRWPTSTSDGRTTMPPLEICCAIPFIQQAMMPIVSDSPKLSSTERRRLDESEIRNQ